MNFPIAVARIALFVTVFSANLSHLSQPTVESVRHSTDCAIARGIVEFEGVQKCYDDNDETAIKRLTCFEVRFSWETLSMSHRYNTEGVVVEVDSEEADGTIEAAAVVADEGVDGLVAGAATILPTFQGTGLRRLGSRRRILFPSQ